MVTEKKKEGWGRRKGWMGKGREVESQGRRQLGKMKSMDGEGWQANGKIERESKIQGATEQAGKESRRGK